MDTLLAFVSYALREACLATQVTHCCNPCRDELFGLSLLRKIWIIKALQLRAYLKTGILHLGKPLHSYINWNSLPVALLAR
jgi:hypothetical protein